MSPLRIAVTGATGHIGNVLVRQLLERGHTVKAGSWRGPPSLEGVDVEHIETDIRVRAHADRLVRGADVVFHLAAIVGTHEDQPHLLWQTNTMGVQTVLGACLHAGVRRVIHFSSIHAFESVLDDTPLNEDRALANRPTDPLYSRSKAEGTRIARSYVERGLEVVLIHPAGVMGPFDFGPSQMMGSLLAGHSRSTLRAVEGGFNFADVRDVAQTAIRAIDAGKVGQSYLVGGHWVSMQSMLSGVRPPHRAPRPPVAVPIKTAARALPVVRGISRLLGRRPPYTEGTLEALSTNRNVDDGRARRELGHAPRPLAETQAAMVEWITSRGMWR